MSGRAKPSAKAACPLCGKPAMSKYAPFCSGRCADLDLGRWLKGGYVIPASPEEGGTAGQGPNPDFDPDLGLEQVPDGEGK